MSNIKYTNLKLFTSASNEKGLMDIDEAIDKAISDGATSLALTDVNSMSFAIQFYQACQKKKIKPIIGVQLSVRNIEIFHGKEIYNTYNVTLLAKNQNGYKNIIKLITLVNSGKHLEKIDESQITKELLEDVIVMTGGMESYFGLTLKSNRYDASEKVQKMNNKIQFWKSLTNDFYIEIQRHGGNFENELNSVIVPLSVNNDVSLIATNDTLFLNKSDYIYHEAIVCDKSKDSKMNKELYSFSRKSDYTPEQYFKTSEEMNELFYDIPNALENTNAIADMCNVEIKLNEVFLPEISSPNPTESINEYFYRLSKEGLDEIFEREKETLGDEYNGDMEQTYRDRLDFELKIIDGMGFQSYFLIVSEFITWAKLNDIPVGPGRGSGAGSLVAYALKITDLDPLKYNLLFERFLNPERVSMPDFDIDFCENGRESVIQHVRNIYGSNSVSQILAFGKYQEKNSLDSACRILGHNSNEMYVKEIKEIVGLKDENKNELDIEEEDEVNLNESEFLNTILKDNTKAKHRIQDDTEFDEVLNISAKLVGKMRNIGVHASGVLISNSNVDNYVPINNIGGRVVSQYDKVDVELAGLVKFDFLGLKNLTVIKEALDLINASREKQNLSKITTHHINANIYDENVYKDIFSNGNTLNVFQFASPPMRKMLKDAEPDRFEDLIALVSLFRPGPMDNIPSFIARKKGIEPIVHLDVNCQALIDILEPTYGIIVYQEQVMQIAQAYAGYTLGGADLLRRAMGKKKPEEMAKQKGVFVEGAVKNGYSEEKAIEIFELMEKFAAYGFNKSHAAAYALVSFQTAWLKKYYPAQYLTAVLNSQIGENKNKDIYISLEDARLNGLNVLPIDINFSYQKFVIDENHNIRMPFTVIKGVSKAQISQIINNREKLREDNLLEESDKVYNSFFDFIKDNRKLLKESVMKPLIEINTFYNIETIENQSWLLENSKLMLNQINAELGNDDSIFGYLSDVYRKNKRVKVENVEYKKVEPFSLHERLQLEYNKTNFIFNKSLLNELYLEKIGNDENFKSSFVEIADLEDCWNSYVDEYKEANPTVNQAPPKEILVNAVLTESAKVNKYNKLKVIFDFYDASGFMCETGFGKAFFDYKFKMFDIYTLKLELYQKEYDFGVRIKDAYTLEQTKEYLYKNAELDVSKSTASIHDILSIIEPYLNKKETSYRNIELLLPNNETINIFYKDQLVEDLKALDINISFGLNDGVISPNTFKNHLSNKVPFDILKDDYIQNFKHLKEATTTKTYNSMGEIINADLTKKIDIKRLDVVMGNLSPTPTEYLVMVYVSEKRNHPEKDMTFITVNDHSAEISLARFDDLFRGYDFEEEEYYILKITASNSVNAQKPKLLLDDVYTLQDLDKKIYKDIHFHEDDISKFKELISSKFKETNSIDVDKNYITFNVNDEKFIYEYSSELVNILNNNFAYYFNKINYETLDINNDVNNPSFVYKEKAGIFAKSGFSKIKNVTNIQNVLPNKERVIISGIIKKATKFQASASKKDMMRIELADESGATTLISFDNSLYNVKMDEGDLITAKVTQNVRDNEVTLIVNEVYTLEDTLKINAKFVAILCEEKDYDFIRETSKKYEVDNELYNEKNATVKNMGIGFNVTVHEKYKDEFGVVQIRRNKEFLPLSIVYSSDFIDEMKDKFGEKNVKLIMKPTVPVTNYPMINEIPFDKKSVKSSKVYKK